MKCDIDDLLAPDTSPPEKPKFIPTSDQARALANLNTWLDNWHRGDPYFVLGGYAGTGKTFCISELAKSGRYKPEQLVFTAPTNKFLPMGTAASAARFMLVTSSSTRLP